jgi:hypothetical protein
VKLLVLSKEVKVGGLEKFILKRFSNSAKIFAKLKLLHQVISQLPRFILEAISFWWYLLIILYMILKTGSFNNALPIISLYVFAGYRLMPALTTNLCFFYSTYFCWSFT